MTPHAAAPAHPLAGRRRVLFVHAHPDDESLSTGALIADLVARGHEVALLTATRGERGEVRPGFNLSGPALVDRRETELAAAASELGITHRAWLGAPPARAAAHPARVYTDSGMRWADAAQTRAVAGSDAGPDALTRADPAEVAADIAAYAHHVDADALVTYDDAGGYGHPDHVFLHAPTRDAAAVLGLPFVEIVSDPFSADLPVGSLPDAVRLDLSAHRATVVKALAHYGTQLVVVGDEVVHVGGNRHPVPTQVALRPIV